MTAPMVALGCAENKRRMACNALLRESPDLSPPCIKSQAGHTF
jgi:hypothetical protein